MDNEQPIRRSTYIWVGMLGIAVALIAVAGISSGQFFSAAAGIALALGYIVLAAATLSNRTFRRISQNIKMPPLRVGVQATATARRAMSRAFKHAVFNPDNILTDVGLIYNRKMRDGAWERRLVTEENSVMIDDAALQPFAKFNVLPANADRVAVVTFEIFDQAGKIRFSRQTEQMIRPGDNTVLCDRQLPLLRGDPVMRSGTWDMKISLNGEVIGIHSFSVRPSPQQRRAYYSGDAEAAIENLKISEDGPTSLDDLLKQQRSESGHHN
jgi:hypothetical protein